MEWNFEKLLKDFLSGEITPQEFQQIYSKLPLGEIVYDTDGYTWTGRIKDDPVILDHLLYTGKISDEIYAEVNSLIASAIDK